MRQTKLLYSTECVFNDSMALPKFYDHFIIQLCFFSHPQHQYAHFLFRQVMKMVLTLVVVFAFCWMPLQLFNLLIDFAPHLLDYIISHEDEQLYYGIFYSCHWVAMANSFTNPIIYGLLNDNFRVRLARKIIFPSVVVFSLCQMSLPDSNEINFSNILDSKDLWVVID